MTYSANGTHEELVVYMQSRDDLTDLELTLFNRLTDAIDEIDIICQAIALPEGPDGSDAGS